MTNIERMPDNHPNKVLPPKEWMKKWQAEVIGTPGRAREVLQKIGIIDTYGGLAEPYRQDGEPARFNLPNEDWYPSW